MKAQPTRLELLNEIKLEKLFLKLHSVSLESVNSACSRFALEKLQLINSQSTNQPLLRSRSLKS
jgi:hypothetical protein